MHRRGRRNSIVEIDCHFYLASHISAKPHSMYHKNSSQDPPQCQDLLFRYINEGIHLIRGRIALSALAQDARRIRREKAFLVNVGVHDKAFRGPLDAKAVQHTYLNFLLRCNDDSAEFGA